MAIKLKSILDSILNIGINEDEQIDYELGKKFYNAYLASNVVVLIFVYLFIVAFMNFTPQFNRYVLFFILTLMSVLLLDLYLNSKNLFSLSLNVSTILTTTIIILFSVYVFPTGSRISSSDYYLPKLLLIFVFTISLIMHLNINSFVLIDLVVVTAYYVLYDIAFIRQYSSKSVELDFQLKDLLLYDITSFIVIIVLLTSFIFFMKIRRRYEKNLLEQKESLEKAYEIINSKNEIITANIDKAKEFHQFILPDSKILDKYFDNFLVYKPSMYISGDFYYFYEKNNTIRIVIADSIGHGLSAAFLSIYAMAALDNKKDLFTDTSQMLTELKSMLDDYRTVPNNIEISFDVAAVFYDKNTNILTYSSAALPIVVVHNGEIRKLEYYRFSISQESRQTVFKHTKIKLEKGDTVYIYTDGIHDLYKMVRKRTDIKYGFNDMMIRLSQKPMKVQKRYLEMHIALSQNFVIPIDDITILGFRV